MFVHGVHAFDPDKAQLAAVLRHSALNVLTGASLLEVLHHGGVDVILAGHLPIAGDGSFGILKLQTTIGKFATETLSKNYLNIYLSKVVRLGLADAAELRYQLDGEHPGHAYKRK